MSPFLKIGIRPDFFYKLIYGNCFSDLGSRGRKKIIKSSENEQLTDHFQSFFVLVFFGHFQSFFFLFLIFPEKTVKLVGQTNSLY